MEIPAVALEHLELACTSRLGSPARWTPPARFRSSLALCVIDAVQCTAGHYPTTLAVTDHYRAYRARQHAAGLHSPGHRDGTRALLRTFEESGGTTAWSGKVAMYRTRHATPAQAVKARSIQRAAAAFHDLRIDATGDLAAMLPHAATRSLAVNAWRGAASHGFTDSWDYLLLLAGIHPVDEASALRHCHRFLAGALPPAGNEAAMRARHAGRVLGLVEVLAERLGTSTEALVLAINRWGNGHRAFAVPGPGVGWAEHAAN
ncbi:hypothetical protein HT102_15085 [Hoyosella sp. G463]|uniref:Heme peroxidase n=1 Tax=Lolliginicoccus lacisalsi TaxID=2742202 RepID=A0A927JF64_9ACTN|nr:hypothetical protein [Lolliginicoccus lacisalsi]MBD8507812.1 hypothetical protein [Lolliginicoccus lacisalsi]